MKNRWIACLSLATALALTPNFAVACKHKTLHRHHVAQKATLHSAHRLTTAPQHVVYVPQPVERVVYVPQPVEHVVCVREPVYRLGEYSTYDEQRECRPRRRAWMRRAYRPTPTYGFPLYHEGYSRHNGCRW